MNDRSGLRLVILSVLVFSLPLTLLGRLWYMQALVGPQYVAAVGLTWSVGQGVRISYALLWRNAFVTG